MESLKCKDLGIDCFFRVTETNEREMVRQSGPPPRNVRASDHRNPARYYTAHPSACWFSRGWNAWHDKGRLERIPGQACGAFWVNRCTEKISTPGLQQNRGTARRRSMKIRAIRRFPAEALWDRTTAISCEYWEERQKNNQLYKTIRQILGYWYDSGTLRT